MYLNHRTFSSTDYNLGDKYLHYFSFRTRCFETVQQTIPHDLSDVN